MKTKVLIIAVALCALVGYLLWKKEREARGIAEQRAADKDAHPVSSDPIAAAKASADSLLESANRLVAAIRQDPGLAGPLGVSNVDADRILLSDTAFSQLYRQVPGVVNAVRRDGGFF